MPTAVPTTVNPGATVMTANNNFPAHSGFVPTRRRRIQVGAVVALFPLVTFLAACGGSSSGTPAAQGQNPATNSAPNNGTRGGEGGAPGAGAFPGASGLIAAASPGTLQVQSATAQTTVMYTASTTFTRVAPGHLAAGDCVTVIGAPEAGSAQGLTATSVRILAKVNGTCPTTEAGGGFAGRGGGGGGGFAQRPSGTPSGGPSAGSGARRAFASAIGTVSSVAGSTVLVNGILRNGPSPAGAATPPAPSTITVTLGAAATVTQTVAATSAAAVLGQCASAIGPADSVGAITAKSITITTPGPNGCRTGFGGGRFNGNDTNPAGSPASNA
jgi:hypothetical protein